MGPAKHDFSNTSGTRSIVKAYVSKACLFLLFWTIIGGRIWLLVTANTARATGESERRGMGECDGREKVAGDGRTTASRWSGRTVSEWEGLG
jgi:hypothetical protein